MNAKIFHMGNLTEDIDFFVKYGIFFVVKAHQGWLKYMQLILSYGTKVNKNYSVIQSLNWLR